MKLKLWLPQFSSHAALIPVMVGPTQPEPLCICQSLFFQDGPCVYSFRLHNQLIASVLFHLSPNPNKNLLDKLFARLASRRCPCRRWRTLRSCWSDDDGWWCWCWSCGDGDGDDGDEDADDSDALMRLMLMLIMLMVTSAQLLSSSVHSYFY